MADDTDINGVVSDSETNDPGQDLDAPDPILHETARSGALSAPVGSRADVQSVATKARSNLENLQQQYGSVQQGLTGAYKEQTKALNDARDRLLSMNFGPSEQEAGFRRAAAFTQSKGEFNPGDVNTANADILAQQRAGELQKQQLLAQYGIQGAQAQIGQYGAMGNSLIQRMRIASGEEKSANTQADKAGAAPKTLGQTGMVWNPDTSKYEFNPEIAKAQEQQKAKNAQDAAAAKMAAANLSAGNMDPANLDFAAQWLHDKGTMPPGFTARMQNGGVNPVTTMIYKRMLEKFPDENASQIIANQGMIAASQRVLNDFESGQTSKDINRLNTSIQHINVLKPVLVALDNGPVPFLNTIKNTWNQQIMGSPAPTDFNGVRDFVTGEISKAVLPNGGGEAERMALAKSAASANSGAALTSILQRWQELLAGKTNATRLQWNNGSMGRFGSFDRFLLPDTKTALGIAPPAPVTRPGQQAAPAQGTHALVSRWLTPPAQPQQ